MTDPQILFFAFATKTAATSALVMAFLSGYRGWGSHIPQSTRIFQGLLHTLALIVAVFAITVLLAPAYPWELF